MFLYNVTLILEESIVGEWMEWMNTNHIPAILNTDMFVSHRLLKVMDSPNEGVTYCIQFVVENQKNYQHYKANFEPSFDAEMNQKFPNKLVSFATLMEFVEQ